MFKLAHNESLDLGYSAFIIINKKMLYSKKREDIVPNHSRVVDAVNELENEMTVSRYKQLKLLINKYIFHSFLVRLSCDYPNMSEIELVNHIRNLSEVEFYESYIHNVIGSEGNFSDESIKESIEVSSNNNSLKEVPSFTTVKYLENHKKEIQSDMIDFLDYYIPLYLKVKNIGVEVAEKSLAIYQKAFPDLESFVNGFNFLNVDIFEEDIDLCGYVTAFMDAAVYIFSIKGKSHFVIGSALTHLLTDEYKVQKESSLFKCLADPTKRKILDLLKGEQLCAGDIVKRLELSKSTVSHHMNHLLSANIIYLSLKEGKKMFYSVNVQFMEETFNNVLDKYTD